MKFTGKCYLILCSAFLIIGLNGCELFEPKTALLWTDQAEFAVYAELFNNSQQQYKIETVYLDAPARELGTTRVFPDLVVGTWLKSTSTRTLFRPLDHFFDDLYLKRSAFYPRLIDLGNIDNKQYLLPVSFNVPALIFSKNNSGLITAPFTLSLDEIKRLGSEYNVKTGNIFTQMGFSPRWSEEFMFICTILYGADFQEGTPLAWEVHALEQALSFIRTWTEESNGSVQAEDEFSFKYLYDPAPKLATSGRILFAYMNSDDLFTVPEERRSMLDFRWIEKDNKIPLMEGAPYLGIVKKGKAKNAANAFVQWFYKEDTQRAILEFGKEKRLNEISFGISNGFSSLKNVNEQIFPHFYPGLLGHVPPADYLIPPNILPGDWLSIKERVLLPFLRDKATAADPAMVPGLERRLSDWYRLNTGR